MMSWQIPGCKVRAKKPLGAVGGILFFTGFAIVLIFTNEQTYSRWLHVEIDGTKGVKIEARNSGENDGNRGTNKTASNQYGPLPGVRDSSESDRQDVRNDVIKKTQSSKLLNSESSYYVKNAKKLGDCAEGLERRLPECIVIGFRKCGTAAIINMLGKHPEVAARDWDPLEVNFFNRKFNKGIEWYRNQMPCSTEGQITIEKTPMYVTSVKAPIRVHSLNPNMKLIILVREPVYRTVSDYLEHHDQSVPFEDTVFDTVNSQIKVSDGMQETLYYYYIRNWLRYFPASQMHILDGDELVRNPAQELKLVEKFLGVRQGVIEKTLVYNEEKGFYCFQGTTGNNISDSGKDACLSKRKGRNHPKIDPAVIKMLKDFYAPYNEMLYSLLGRRFTWNF